MENNNLLITLIASDFKGVKSYSKSVTDCPVSRALKRMFPNHIGIIMVGDIMVDAPVFGSSDVVVHEAYRINIDEYDPAIFEEQKKLFYENPNHTYKITLIRTNNTVSQEEIVKQKFAKPIKIDKSYAVFDEDNYLLFVISPNTDTDIDDLILQSVNQFVYANDLKNICFSSDWRSSGNTRFRDIKAINTDDNELSLKLRFEEVKIATKIDSL